MTDWIAGGFRFALYIDLMLLFGLAAFGFHARTARPAGHAVLMLLALVGAMLGIAAFVHMAAGMVGGSISDLDAETRGFILWQTPAGIAFVVRTTALALLVAVLWRQAPRWIVAVLATVALGSLAWTGHAAATEGWAGTLHRMADVLHLIAAAAWLGALTMLLALLGSGARTGASLDAMAETLDRFGPIGAGIVGALVTTGAINLVMIVGLDGFGDVVAGTYGLLLAAKLALFAAMLGMAANNRWRLTPRFRAGADAGALRRSILVEAAAAVAILILVAWLGMLDPLA